jgi:hypothetical protein
MEGDAETVVLGAENSEAWAGVAGKLTGKWRCGWAFDEDGDCGLREAKMREEGGGGKGGRRRGHDPLISMTRDFFEHTNYQRLMTSSTLLIES